MDAKMTLLLFPTMCKTSCLMFWSSGGIFSSAQTFNMTPPSDSDLFEKYEPGIKISVVPVKRGE